MRVSEIRVNQIRVNQGLGVFEKKSFQFWAEFQTHVVEYLISVTPLHKQLKMRMLLQISKWFSTHCATTYIY